MNGFHHSRLHRVAAIARNGEHLCLYNERLVRLHIFREVHINQYQGNMD